MPGAVRVRKADWRNSGRDIVRVIGDGVPQRRVPRLARPRGLDFCARLAGQHRARRQLHLIRDVAGFDEAEPLAGLRRNVNGVSQFRLLLLEIGDLRAQPLLARRQLIHLGPLGEIRTHRARDRQREHTDHRGEDGRPPRSRTQPLFGLLFGRLGDRLADRVALSSRSSGSGLAPRLGLARLASRRGTRPRTARAESPGLPDLADLAGRDAGDRRFGSGRFASGTGYLASGANLGNARSPA